MTIDHIEIAAYLTGVSAALSDLDTDERDDLLADIHAHLTEVAREGGSLTARLGPPDAYAAELRAAAGMPEAVKAPGPPLMARLVTARAALASHNLVERAVGLARTLAPIWWLARGYVAAVVLARIVDGAGWSTRHPWIPHVRGSGTLGLLAVLAAIGVSIWLGMRRAGDRRVRAALVLANLALLVVAMPLAGRLNDGYDRPEAAAITVAFWQGYNNEAENLRQPSSALLRYGEPIRNIYPYSRDGKLLLDVLLYDEFGKPINLGSHDESNRRYLTSRAGQQLLNSVPLRYIEPDGNVLHPLAGPRIRVPRIVTPSLVPTIGFDSRFAMPSPDPRSPKG